MRRLLLLLLLWPATGWAQIVEYYHLDAVGNVMAVTDSSGAVVEQHDYLPFGEEWCGTGVCGTVTAGQPKRFTGKERDAETGLDYFGARYYGSKVGRFTTIDPADTIPQNLVDPQRWNRYVYVRNNPLRYIDPTGLYIWGDCAGPSCAGDQQRFRDSLVTLNKAAEGLPTGSDERKDIDKILAKYGKEGEGHVRINFGGDAEGDLGLAKGRDVTLDYRVVDKTISTFGLDASQAAALDAGLAAHEGRHVGSRPGILAFPQMRGEHAAYRSESYTYQGLKNTDVVFGLWDQKWLALAQLQLEQARAKAVDENARRK